MLTLGKVLRIPKPRLLPALMAGAMLCANTLPLSKSKAKLCSKDWRRTKRCSYSSHATTAFLTLFSIWAFPACFWNAATRSSPSHTCRPRPRHRPRSSKPLLAVWPAHRLWRQAGGTPPKPLRRLSHQSCCGPDTMLQTLFRQEMASKPYLQIEVDEHFSPVGVITRIEAFLHSLENRPTLPLASDFLLPMCAPNILL